MLNLLTEIPSEDEYLLITENSNDLIAIFDHEFKIVYRNHVFNEKLGYNSELLNDLGPMDLIHPEDYNMSLSALRNTIFFGKGKLEARIMHKKGHYIWFEIRGRSFLDNDGKKKGIMIAKDVNDRKLAELRLKNSLNSLKELYN